ncbi:hypothetical protein [Kitasatospora sp. NPDC093679]|uniref:hypothetical protein n=1 Tax=Kitasatospora sp. NPDC093679 TaxID=3154983 RepID=UPI00342A33ED
MLFPLGFAPPMQATRYETGTTAVLAVTAERLPRLTAVLPPVAAVAVPVITPEVFARTPEHGGPPVHPGGS